MSDFAPPWADRVRTGTDHVRASTDRVRAGTDRVSARTTSSLTRIPELGAPVFCESAENCDRGGALAFYPVQTNFALPRGKSGIASPNTPIGQHGYGRRHFTKNVGRNH